jgi:sortase (surface protein transpeptidase)
VGEQPGDVRLRDRPWVRRVTGVLVAVLLATGSTLIVWSLLDADADVDHVVDVSEVQAVPVGEPARFVSDPLPAATAADQVVTPPTPPPTPAPSDLPDGSPIGRVVIPTIGLDTPLVVGTSATSLAEGVGHYPETPAPGASSNVGLAGHRTTYGAPFNRIDELSVGDTIWVRTTQADLRYEVTAPPAGGDCTPYTGTAGSAACVTHPYDWSVVDPADEALLTLTTCHPKGSAAERLIVRAHLAETLPRGNGDLPDPAARTRSAWISLLVASPWTAVTTP